MKAIKMIIQWINCWSWCIRLWSLGDAGLSILFDDDWWFLGRCCCLWITVEFYCTLHCSFCNFAFYISYFFPHEFQHMDHVYFFFVGKILLVNKCNYGTKTEYDMSYLEIYCFNILKLFKNVWSTVLTINKSPKS